MKRKTASLALLLLAVVPVPAPDAPTPPPPVATAATPVKTTAALAEFQRRLLAEGRTLVDHGVYIESLDRSAPLAAFNEDIPFNPASVIKLATSLAALDALGSDFRFRTELLADGEIDPRTHELEGDLILRSGADPSFSISDARAVGDSLRHLGINRVRGDLIVVGGFNCNYNSQTDVSAGVFRRQSRLSVSGVTRFETASATGNRGRLLLTVESEPLLKIVYYQNAHSVNAMADLLATRIGGADGIRRFLVNRLRLAEDSVFISRASGLDVNRITARDTVVVLRALVKWLDSKGIAPEAVMPVAGVDAGTLIDRFADENFRGSVVAKTGTLHDTDGGVAALAGLAYTNSCGPVVFAIYDMAEGRRVEHLRQVQDSFLKDSILELGGPSPRPVDETRRETPAPTGRVLFPGSATANN